MAGIHNFDLRQGDTWNTIITLAQDGSAINLTGYSATLQMRPSVDSDTKLLDLTTDNGGLVVATPANGQIQINASAATMAAIARGVYPYELQITSGTGIRTTMLAGYVTLTREVAR